MRLSNATNSCRDTCLRSPGTSGCGGGDYRLGERQVVLALCVLADLVDVRLRAMLCVVVLKELHDPLRLLVDLLLRGARRDCLAACRFDGRMQTSKTSAVYRRRLLGVSPASA